MNKCLLCKTSDADKKGSHIVPHFLLKRIENIDNKPGRDYELGFAIGEIDTESYFGRAVPPERLEDTFGELSDEEIESNKHPLVVDFYFCSYCETRLSKIESEYASTLATFNQQTIYESGITSNLGLLFWSSIFWRMSIHRNSGTYLSDPENEELRKLLDTFLATDVSSIDQLKMSADEKAKNVSYRLLRCPNFSDANITYMLWHPRFRKVYSLIIDEFVVSFALKDDYEEYTFMDFFNLNATILSVPKNMTGTMEMITPISVAKMDETNRALVNSVASVRRDTMSGLWDELHVELGGQGTSMPNEIKNEILKELQSEEKLLGRKHNLTEIQDSTIKIMLRYDWLYRKPL